ncbi:MAG: ABC transporter ATP-binding protein [Candidatus Tectimicrobiota bacterium]|nr:MAG: ABC transporter ATP-binding protein [Candidatus Tectomicrobia bacterium]
MAEGAHLVVHDLDLAFGGLQVLHRVSLEVRPGELVALIGPNGAGKTSVLNCISGLYRPSGGRILVDEVDITGWRADRVARLAVARTFQHGELFRHLTVLDNLLVARHRHIRSTLLWDGLFWGRARRQEIVQRQAVEAVLEFMELERYRKTPVAHLPFGLQKRVGFARALALEPRVLLLDEPSAGMQREEKEDLARFLLRIKHELGITLLWVEHDMQMVADLAERLYVLNYGENVANGPPAQVLADPRVVEMYLGATMG